jgi:recombination protein RecA
MKKERLSLLPEELEVIYGGLLGDTHLRKDRNELAYAHSINQSEYLTWKYNKLKRIAKDIYGIDSNGFKQERFSVWLNDEDYKYIYLLTYDHFSVTKTVTRKWLNLLTPLSLAIWWMDDGCLSIHKGNRYGKLCTHSFSYEEHLIIKQYFKVVWDIDVQIKLEKQKYYFCRLNVENLKKLFNIIHPFIFEVPSMMYKIDLKYTINKQSLPPFNL